MAKHGWSVGVCHGARFNAETLAVRWRERIDGEAQRIKLVTELSKVRDEFMPAPSTSATRHPKGQRP